jgi:hypothetical protein
MDQCVALHKRNRVSELSKGASGSPLRKTLGNCTLAACASNFKYIKADGNMKLLEIAYAC